MPYKRKASYHFATEAETGINTIPVGSLIIIENYSSTGFKTFRKLNDTSIIAGTTITQAIANNNITEAGSSNVIAMTANDINMSRGKVFTKTITGISTLTFSGANPSPFVSSFILKLTNGGAFAITWPTGIKWAGGLAPVLSAAGVDELMFYTEDGGVTYSGYFAKKDSK